MSSFFNKNEMWTTSFFGQNRVRISEVVHFTHQCLLPRLERSKTNEGEGEVWDPNQMNNQKCYTTTTQFKAARFLYYTLKVASASTPLTQEQIPPSFLRVRVQIKLEARPILTARLSSLGQQQQTQQPPPTCVLFGCFLLSTLG